MRLARRRVARSAVLSVALSWQVAAAQAGAWAVSPPRPTVGDTVWVARHVTVPAAWRVRAGKFEDADEVGSLGDAAVLRAPDGWVIRYPVVVWVTGGRTIAMPPGGAWRRMAAPTRSGGTVRLDVPASFPPA
jgi:hypothetical protein